MSFTDDDLDLVDISELHELKDLTASILEQELDQEAPSSWRDQAYNSIVLNTALFSTMDFSVTLERCHEKLSEYANAGSISEVTSLLSQPHFWNLSSDESIIFQIVKSQYIPQNEHVIKGWFLLQLNQFGSEQERLLVVSDKAIYRIKYSWEQKSVLKVSRTDMKEIRALRHGNIIQQAQRRALRIFTCDPALETRLKLSQLITPNFSLFNTFTCPPLPPPHDEYLARSILKEVLAAISVVLIKLRGCELDLVLEDVIYCPKRIPFVSSLGNFFRK
ncbi:hypothetical protein RCL1_000045 [Eukaryota sp. TZLM3-RCL]